MKSSLRNSEVLAIEEYYTHFTKENVGFHHLHFFFSAMKSKNFESEEDHDIIQYDPTYGKAFLRHKQFFFIFPVSLRSLVLMGTASFTL